jgi:thymidylate kinase
MTTQINKIIAVEGLDKTGKTTFVEEFDATYHSLFGSTINELKKFSFPNALTPIGKSIRDELNSVIPNKSIVNTPNFLAEMSHYWLVELFEQHYENSIEKPSNNINKEVVQVKSRNYIFDRYFISTLAYQAFYNNSKADLDFIKTSLNNNKFIKFPTDIILLDLPNSIIIERTLADKESGIIDANDTTDELILNKRREAYISAIKFLKGAGINIHWFEDVSKIDTGDLVRVLMGKIFQ